VLFQPFRMLHTYDKASHTVSLALLARISSLGLPDFWERTGRQKNSWPCLKIIVWILWFKVLGKENLLMYVDWRLLVTTGEGRNRDEEGTGWAWPSTSKTEIHEEDGMRRGLRNALGSCGSSGMVIHNR
jgi:hypothetical protein